MRRWWCCIASTELLRHARRRSWSHDRLDREHPSQHPSQHPSPESASERHEELDSIRRSIWSLSAHHREVLVLRGLHRYPWPVIVRMTERASEAAARRAFSRALAALRKQMVQMVQTE